MKRIALFGSRTIRFQAANAARFINARGTIVEIHRRRADKKCPTCWDDYSKAYDPKCTDCENGYVKEIMRKKAYFSFAQPFGGSGEATNIYHSGGMMQRRSAYLYMDSLHGKDVREGDRVIIRLEGRVFELSILNIQPQMIDQNTVGLYVMECSTPANKTMGE